MVAWLWDVVLVMKVGIICFIVEEEPIERITLLISPSVMIHGHGHGRGLCLLVALMDGFVISLRSVNDNENVDGPGGGGVNQ
jgi:hypothetical protein